MRLADFYIHYRPLIGGIAVFVMLMGLSGCKPDEDPTENAPAQQQQDGWPRTFNTLKGPLTLQHPPQRIVSTSVTLTGTLLAIDAPIVASGATSPSSKVADRDGFLSQWGDVARARNVKPIYQTEPNAEAIAGENPDFIVISATGGDSALKLYEQLSTLAPTLVINYDDKSWQALSSELAGFTGHEAQAKARIADFETRVTEAKKTIQLPPQPTSAFVYREDGKGANLWTLASAQGKLLTELGFTLAIVPEAVRGETSMGSRQDIIQLSGEKLAQGLNGNTFFLLSADQSVVTSLMGNTFLQHLPAVQQHQVFALGNDTFRLDYYSASNMLKHITNTFSSPQVAQ